MLHQEAVNHLVDTEFTGSTLLPRISVPYKALKRRDLAGSAYSPDELTYIREIVLDPHLLRTHLVLPLFQLLTKSEQKLHGEASKTVSLENLVGIEKISENYRMVPLLEQPIGSICVGIKGQDTSRLQTSFTVNQKEHGMTGSASHPGLEAKIGTWFQVETDTDQLSKLKFLYDAIPYAFFGDHPLFQPRSWVMDPEVESIWLAADTAVHMFSKTGEHSIIVNPQFEAPHDVSITGRDAVFVCSSMDSIAFVDKRTQKMRDIMHLADFGYGHSIGTKTINGVERRLLYYYSDQEPPSAYFGEYVVEEDRNEPIGVPTALQRLHPNAVLCIDDTSMLVSLFNSVELNELGQVDLGKSGGKVVHITTEEVDNCNLETYMNLYAPRGFSINWSRKPYTQESTGITVTSAAYLRNISNPSQRVVIKEISKNGEVSVQIQILNEVITGLKNPHGLVQVGTLDGKELYGVSDTNTGTFKVFSFDKKNITAEIIYELNFDDASEVSKLEGRTGNWIHHPRLMKHKGEIFLSVYDGKRSGIWIVNLSQKVSSFVPMPEDAVVYQTQIYPR